jgi:hypothetical protein
VNDRSFTEQPEAADGFGVRWVGSGWCYLVIGDADARFAEERGELIHLTITEFSNRSFPSDDKRGYKDRIIRSQYAEVAVARLLGQEPTPVRDPRNPGKTTIHQMRTQPDIDPDIEVRSSQWSLLRALKSKYQPALPPNVLIFYETGQTDIGREARRFVAVATGGPTEMKAFGWAYGWEIKQYGERFSYTSANGKPVSGWYIEHHLLPHTMQELEGIPAKHLDDTIDAPVRQPQDEEAVAGGYGVWGEIAHLRAPLRCERVGDRCLSHAAEWFDAEANVWRVGR